ncbi:ABC transporter ATP-binding protein [Rhizobium calliandrae]|uniref:ABC transporter ATP-binding protein n=1 Tax=Rhizobium calliandrae TaxID=1312182 RepID=A0ABT7KKL9_9HYPH|nr:ABC transporter ATP-binding protein [Rhizobium calliandrae]MDL2409183.1 ABC transporter ATP-binding protein [Rhizobium calliandrae]
MMGDPLAETHGLCRSFADGNRARLPVLFDINCHIDASDRIALVGVSGSGKTTLLHILGGLDVPTTGAIAWPALGQRETLRPAKVAFVFQRPSLFPALSVAQNVALPVLLLEGRDNAEVAALDLLDQFGLLDLAAKLPEEISGGQAQCVAMARALITKPRLILADEPTGQLDSAGAHHLLDIALYLVGESGAAFVLATHDEAVAARLDIRWSLDAGRLSTDVLPREARR